MGINVEKEQVWQQENNSNNINLHISKDTGRLIPFVGQIEKEFNESVDKISKLMPISDVNIAIFDNPHMAIPELGIGAIAFSSNLIDIYINPEFTGLSDSISKEFKRTMAHELHHTIRSKTINNLDNLLGALISEGLADHFDMEANDTLPHLWDKALSKEELINFEKLGKKEYFNKNYNHSDWFYGSSKDIPRWTGYSLGFYLVEKYLKSHPDQKASTLYNVQAEDFLK